MRWDILWNKENTDFWDPDRIPRGGDSTGQSSALLHFVQEAAADIALSDQTRSSDGWISSPQGQRRREAAHWKKALICLADSFCSGTARSKKSRTENPSPVSGVRTIRSSVPGAEFPVHQFQRIPGPVTADVFRKTSGGGRSQKRSFQAVFSLWNKITGFFADFYRDRERPGKKYGFSCQVCFDNICTREKKLQIRSFFSCT